MSAAKEFSSSALGVKGVDVTPWGIWSDGATMWVVDDDENIYSYNMPVSDNADLRAVQIGGEDLDGFDPDTTVQSLGVASNATMLTVAVAPLHFKATAAITSTDADMNTSGHQIDVTSAPAVVTVLVTAQDTTTTKTYTLTIGRVPGEVTIGDSNVTPGNQSLGVTWTAPTAVDSNPITAYDLRYLRDSGADKEIDSNWTVVPGVWSAGTLAATVSGLTNDVDYLVQVRAVNSSGAGAWPPTSRVGRGTPTPSGSDDATLSALAVSPGTLDPAFTTGASTRAFAVDVAGAVEEITFTYAANHDAASVALYKDSAALTDADLNANGFQVALVRGANAIELRVTAENTSTETYTVTVTRAPRSRDATLSDLQLSAGSLTETFAPAKLTYTATVPYGASRITVTPTKSHPGATVRYGNDGRRQRNRRPPGGPQRGRERPDLRVRAGGGHDGHESGTTPSPSPAACPSSVSARPPATPPRATTSSTRSRATAP